LKQLIKSYSFSKTAGTVAFSDFSTNLRQDRILLITDVTVGVILYQFNSSSLSGSVASNVLTLDYDTNTSAFSNSDALMIIYDSSSTDPVYDSYPVTLDSLLAGEDLTNNVMGTLMKPVVGSQYDTGTYQSLAAVTHANIKAAAGNLFSVMVTNANSAARWFQLFNSTSAPSGGATPLLTFIIPVSEAIIPPPLILDTNFFAPSNYFSTGISWAVSTTGATFTDAATAGDHEVTINYV
jgi:hypothetical protein